MRSVNVFFFLLTEGHGAEYRHLMVTLYVGKCIKHYWCNHRHVNGCNDTCACVYIYIYCWVYLCFIHSDALMNIFHYYINYSYIFYQLPSHAY